VGWFTWVLHLVVLVNVCIVDVGSGPVYSISYPVYNAPSGSYYQVVDTGPTDYPAGYGLAGTMSLCVIFTITITVLGSWLTNELEKEHSKILKIVEDKAI